MFAARRRSASARGCAASLLPPRKPASSPARSTAIVATVRVALMLVALAATLLAPRHAFAGEAWVALTPLEAQIGMRVVAPDPLVPATIYADANLGRGIARSSDGGRTWQVLPFEHAVDTIVVERSGPERVTILGWDATIARSSDGGASWTVSENLAGLHGWPRDVAVDPRDTNVLYLALERYCFISCEPGGLAKSINGGRTWSIVFKDVPKRLVVIDPNDPRTIYAIGDSVHVSGNGGSSWNSFGNPGGTSGTSLVADPVVPGVVYAGTQGFRLWRSDDRGRHWTRLGGDLEFYARSFAVDPTDRSVLVVGGETPRALGKEEYDVRMRSVNGGASWHSLDGGLVLALDPLLLDGVRVVFGPDGTLWCASSSRGVMKLSPTPGIRRRPVRR